jgi:hypothetical protein
MEMFFAKTKAKRAELKDRYDALIKEANQIDNLFDFTDYAEASARVGAFSNNVHRYAGRILAERSFFLIAFYGKSLAREMKTIQSRLNKIGARQMSWLNRGKQDVR